MDATYMAELMDMLNSAPHGQQSAIVQTAAELHGVSTMTVYRHLKKAGWTSGRKHRTDKGQSAIDVDTAAKIGAIMRATDRANGKRLASVKLAASLAEANGIIASEMHPATVSRRLKEAGFHPTQMRRPTPHVTLATNHPNHMWQIDPSFCVLYYLKGGKEMAVMDEAKFYKNKPANFGKITNERVLRYVCVDHCTGAFFCYYYNVAGENTETMFDFLMRAMGEKDKQHNPFEGVPKILYWDKGSANQSALITNLLQGLGIKHHAHVKGNSRAKGSVEQHNNIIEKGFEARLAFCKISSIEQLNQACELWQRSFQATYKHTRHGMTRFAAWRKIKASELIERPPIEVCRILLTHKPQQRKVNGNYHISFAIEGYGSNQYRVDCVDNVRIGEMVTVQVNPFAAPNIWVTHPDQYGNPQRYEISPLTQNEWGFYDDAVAVDGHFQTAPLTDIDRNRIDVDELAWGTRDEQQIDKLRTQKSAPAFDGKVNPFSGLDNASNSKVRHIPKQGKPLEISEQAPQQLPINPLFVPADTKPREEAVLPIIDFIRWAAKRTALTPELNTEIRASYPDGLPESAFEDALAALRRNQIKIHKAATV